MIITGTRLRGGRYYGGTASVTDTYFNLVSLLLPGTGTNGAQNNTFLDSSTNAFTVTRNGNTTQGTFSPFSQTGWSNYFGGTNYLTSSYNIAFAPGSGDFTVECFVYFTASPTGTDQGFAGNINMSTGDGDWLLFWRGGASRWEFSATSNGSVGTIQRSFNTTTPTVGQWYHVVGVKNGSTLSCYVDGVKGTDGTLATVNNGSLTLNIGQGASNTGRLTGNISNLRITKGGALYSGSTFTPPAAPLTTTVSAGTVSLLTCQSNRFIDNSTNAFALVTSGAAVQAFAPFNPTTAYSTSTVGGSAYFDGTGDYLTVANNAAFDLGSGDATIEAWIYPTSSGQTCGIFDKRSSGANYSQFPQVALVSGAFTAYVSYTGSSWAGVINGATPAANTWTHVAFVRSGNTWTLYVNGAISGTPFTASGSVYTSTDSLVIGASTTTGTNAFAGQISNARVVKGTAVYTSAFTPPTSPLTAVTNTQLLLNYTNAGIPDATAKNVLETVGNAQISTVQSKFGGSSMAFDGTGDYLKSRLNDPIVFLGVGNWTIEGWVYLNTTSGTQTFIIGQSDYTNAANASYSLHVAGSSAGDFFYGSSFVSLGAPGLSATTWTHCAWVRNGSTITFYRNGTSITSLTIGTNSINNGTTNPRCIGGANNGLNQLNGYINDLRITKGYARYTANFTPPTQAFPTQ